MRGVSFPSVRASPEFLAFPRHPGPPGGCSRAELGTKKDIGARGPPWPRRPRGAGMEPRAAGERPQRWETLGLATPPVSGRPLL